MSYPWSSEIDEFLALLLASRLLGTKEIRELCDEINVDAKSKGMLNKFSEHLVSKDAITQWQCDLLRKGKYRGFFLDNYRLLDQIERDYSTYITTYLALDIESSQKVGIRITPPSEGNSMTYDVVDVDLE